MGRLEGDIKKGSKTEIHISSECVTNIVIVRRSGMTQMKQRIVKFAWIKIKFISFIMKFRIIGCLGS